MAKGSPRLILGAAPPGSEEGLRPEPVKFRLVEVAAPRFESGERFSHLVQRLVRPANPQQRVGQHPQVVRPLDECARRFVVVQRGP